MSKLWRYVQLKNLREVKKDERICACYPCPVQNTSGKKTDENIIRAAKDAKEGKCKLLVWREVETDLYQEDRDKETLNLIYNVEKLHYSTPEGEIRDADIILRDLIDGCDYEFYCLAQDIFNIWKASTDKKAVEQMFYEFTDTEFEDYLKKCKEEISR